MTAQNNTRPTQIMRPRYCIGIDPGTHTGLAVWDTQEKRFVRIETTNIIKAIDYVRSLKGVYSFMVFIEDARKRRDKGLTDEKRMGAGSVRRDCSIWQEVCEMFKIEYQMLAPSAKSNKLAKKENLALFQLNAKWTKTTSEHARCAAMLVINR